MTFNETLGTSAVTVSLLLEALILVYYNCITALCKLAFPKKEQGFNPRLAYAMSSLRYGFGLSRRRKPSSLHPSKQHCFPGGIHCFKLSPRWKDFWLRVLIYFVRAFDICTPAVFSLARMVLFISAADSPYAAFAVFFLAILLPYSILERAWDTHDHLADVLDQYEKQDTEAHISSVHVTPALEQEYFPSTAVVGNTVIDLPSLPPAVGAGPAVPARDSDDNSPSPTVNKTPRESHAPTTPKSLYSNAPQKSATFPNVSHDLRNFPDIRGTLRETAQSNVTQQEWSAYLDFLERGRKLKRATRKEFRKGLLHFGSAVLLFIVIFQQPIPRFAVTEEIAELVNKTVERRPFFTTVEFPNANLIIKFLVLLLLPKRLSRHLAWLLFNAAVIVAFLTLDITWSPMVTGAPGSVQYKYTTILKYEAGEWGGAVLLRLTVVASAIVWFFNPLWDVNMHELRRRVVRERKREEQRSHQNES